MESTKNMLWDNKQTFYLISRRFSNLLEFILSIFHLSLKRTIRKSNAYIGNNEYSSRNVNVLWQNNKQNNMDPWPTCQINVTVPEIPITKFEDNFTPAITGKLPDSEEYLAVLEEKLRRIKNDPSVLDQLSAKKEACMQQLLSSAVYVEEEIIKLDEPVANSQILRVIAPQKQALNQGEIVELVKYDQLKDESDSEVNKESKNRTT